MSAATLLELANDGRLITGPDANPWNHTRFRIGLTDAAASNRVTVALWEAGLLELGPPTEEGHRHWSLTPEGHQALQALTRRGMRPAGDMPPIGGPYR